MAPGIPLVSKRGAVAAPQQPELHRSGLTPADPGSAKAHQEVDEHVTARGAGPRGPVPEANRPGHHPDVEQDKPVERFAAKARELAEEAHAAEGQDAPPEQAGDDGAATPVAADDAPPRRAAVFDDVPAQPEVDAEARHTGEEDLAQPSPGPSPGLSPSASPTASPSAPPSALRSASPSASRSASPGPSPGTSSGAGVPAPPLNPLTSLTAPAAAAWDIVRHTAPPLVALPPLAAWDALRQPGMAWTEIDESRTAWLARIALIPFVGAWRYATGVRPRLEGAGVALRLRGG